MSDFGDDPTADGPPTMFAGVETVVADPLHFKAKLGIGEKAYASLRLRNAAFEAWDVAGVAVTGAAAAKSSVVAGTFFAGTGFWAWLGLGGTAATPIGWVIAAGAVSGVAWLGITRYLRSRSDGRLTVIPAMINTPMDVLALGLFDLMAPLALRVAGADGQISTAERDFIARYFTRDWGYDAGFVTAGLGYAEPRAGGLSLPRLARALARMKRDNPDCDYASMTRETLGFLGRLAVSDGAASPDQVRALAQIERAFTSEGRSRLGRALQGARLRLSRSLPRRLPRRLPRPRQRG